MTTTTTADPLIAPHHTVTATQRLVSLDALRGFDMFWIVGGEEIISSFHHLWPNAGTDALAHQFTHTPWDGFRLYDLIFPMFVFMMGVSMVFSLSKTIAQEGRGAAVKRIIRRSVLLFVLALIYSGLFASEWPDMRLMGVLNRFSIAYLFGGLLFCYCRPRALIGVLAAILIGYWALLTFIPVRDITLTNAALQELAEKNGDTQSAEIFRNAQRRNASNPSAVKNSPTWAAAEKLFYSTTQRVSPAYGEGKNLPDHLDFQYLPARKYDKYYDPEGLLSSLPAVGTCLLGALVGLFLRSKTAPETKTAFTLIGCGIALAAVGWIWGLQFPVVKKIWTSTFVLVAGGYSCIFLGFFYYIIDVAKIQKWSRPFVWIGMNPITIYFTAHILVRFDNLAERLAGGDISNFLDAHIAKGMGDFVLSLIAAGLMFWFMKFLHDKKIFLRI